MEKRFSSLRIIGTIYKVLGIIAAVLTLLGVVSLCATLFLGSSGIGGFWRDFGPGFGQSRALGGVLTNLLGIVFVLIYGGAISVTMYGFGEGVYLLLALEENTRKTAEMLSSPKG